MIEITNAKQVKALLKRRLGESVKEVERVIKQFAFFRANEFDDIYQKGLLNKSFGLTPLEPRTIKYKRYKNFKYPNNPLVGKGTDDRNSLINMLEIRDNKSKKRFEVIIKEEPHWDPRSLMRGYNLLDVFYLASDGNVTGRDPIEPAFNRLRKSAKNKAETKRLLTEALTQYINKGEKKYFNKLISAVLANMPQRG